MTADVIRNMTDSQLETLSSTDDHDLTNFTDAELDAIVNGTACPDLICRVAQTKKSK
jgi:hypothetical protein